MPRDYYQDLEINRDASTQEVAKAYRKLSLRWHPKLSQQDPRTTTHNFCVISEAYEVLSDPVKRSFFDKYGEEKLKEGFFTQGHLKGGYRFGGNPDEIFEQFFGTNNPFAQIYDSEGQEAVGSLLGYAFGAQNFPGIPPPPNLEVQVDCTLNELYNGCSKDIKYLRTILNNDGRTTREITETKQIEIKPGYGNGTTIIFEKLGHEAAGLPTSSLIFYIRELAHSQFKRKNNDLIYTAQISLSDALSSEPVHLVTLDSRKLYVAMDQIINPQTIKQVKGEGMPIYNQDEFKVENFGKPLDRADLFIKFDIEFPKFIPEEKQNEIKEILKDSY